MTVLITGFEPFGDVAENPSELVARALHERAVADHRVIGAVLPCVFGASIEALLREIARADPALVVCTGVADRAAISIERVAINVDDARITDNAGARPIDRPIDARGPAAYFATLPIKDVARALAASGVPSEISDSAGTFVCNHVFYGLMRELASRPRARGGFVHVPPLARVPLATQTRALEIVIEASLAKIR